MDKEGFASLVPEIGEKIKEGSVHAFNKNQTKQYHYGPPTIIPISGTPIPSKQGD